MNRLADVMMIAACVLLCLTAFPAVTRAVEQVLADLIPDHEPVVSLTFAAVVVLGGLGGSAVWLKGRSTRRAGHEAGDPIDDGIGRRRRPQTLGSR